MTDEEQLLHIMKQDAAHARTHKQRWWQASRVDPLADHGAPEIEAKPKRNVPRLMLDASP